MNLNDLIPRTPRGKALAVGAGLGVATVVAVVAARASASSKAKATTWQGISPEALGRPGRYRVEIMLPPTALSMQEDNDQFRSVMDRLQKALPGLKIEGAWEDFFAYPANSTLPSDWPFGKDAYGPLHRFRAQYTSLYTGGDPIIEAFRTDMGAVPVLYAWQDPTTVIPPAGVMPLPYAFAAVSPPSFAPGQRYAISMPAVPATDIQNMAVQLANQGFVIRGSWAGQRPDGWPPGDGSPANRWLFDVQYMGAARLGNIFAGIDAVRVFGLAVDVP